MKNESLICRKCARKSTGREKTVIEINWQSGRDETKDKRDIMIEKIMIYLLS